jgi:hypothetical protein
LGAALILVPALGWCLSQPNFVRDVLVGQLERPPIGMSAKLHYLLQNMKRYPPVLIGLVTALVIIVKARDARLRILALMAFGSTLTLVLAFKTFFAYYIVQSLPWLAFMFAVAVHALAQRWLPARGPALTIALVLVMGLAAPAAHAEVYERHGAMHVAGPQRILPLLDRDGGKLYSMYPAFGLWTGRRMSPWYYEADSLVPRINGWIKERDFVRVFSQSDALVLYTGELDEYPQANEYVKRHFREAYRDEYWLVWLRAKPR